MTVDCPSALIAAIAALMIAAVHGIAGHRWMNAQLGSVDLRPTPISERLFGEREVTWRVVGVAWHGLTVLFLGSAAVFLLTAFGALESRDLLRFVVIDLVAVLVVGLIYMGGVIFGEKTLDAFRSPVPPFFTVAMVAMIAFGWIASNSV